MDCGPLTIGERFLIHRMRLGKSQESFASGIGLSRNQFGKLERDAKDAPVIPPPSIIRNLRDYEKCLILRKRSGKSQDQCALEMKISRFWFNKMESNQVSNQALIDFWG